MKHIFPSILYDINEAEERWIIIRNEKKDWEKRTRRKKEKPFGKLAPNINQDGYPFPSLSSYHIPWASHLFTTFYTLSLLFIPSFYISREQPLSTKQRVESQSRGLFYNAYHEAFFLSAILPFIFRFLFLLLHLLLYIFHSYSKLLQFFFTIKWI